MPTGIAAGLAGKTAIMQLHASDGVCLSMARNDVKRADGTFFKAGK